MEVTKADINKWKAQWCELDAEEKEQLRAFFWEIIGETVIESLVATAEASQFQLTVQTPE